VQVILFNKGVHARLLAGQEHMETYFRKGEVVEGSIEHAAGPGANVVDLRLDDGSVAIGVPKNCVSEETLDYADIQRWDLGG